MDATLVFQSILAIAGFLFVWILNQVSLQLKRLTDSVESLNVKMAVYVERSENHERRITRLESQKGE